MIKKAKEYTQWEAICIVELVLAGVIIVIFVRGDILAPASFHPLTSLSDVAKLAFAAAPVAFGAAASLAVT